MPLGLDDLREIIQKDRWKDVLMELVVNNKIDPWNVDIEVVADEFLKYIKQINQFDLSVPANIVLATSIILKYKADTLRYIFDDENEEDDYTDDYLDLPPIKEIPKLTMVNRIPPKRKVTLTELIDEIENVMKYDEKSERRVKHKINYVPLVLDIKEMDAEKNIDDTYLRIKGSIDTEGWTTFSRLLDDKKPYTIVITLLSLLYLYQREEIIIKQDDIFEEIFIRFDNQQSEKQKNSTKDEIKNRKTKTKEQTGKTIDNTKSRTKLNTKRKENKRRNKK